MELLKEPRFRQMVSTLDQYKDAKRIELYQSSDPKATGIYFTTDRSKPAVFELLVLEHNRDELVFLRYPNEDRFIRITGRLHGSGQGSMTTSGGQNVWANKHDRKIKFYSHAPNLLMCFGDTLPSFTFMTLIARRAEKEMYHSNDSVPASFGEELIDIVMGKTFLALPDEARKVEYAYKSEDGNVFFIVDYPLYNFQYENFRCFRRVGTAVDELTVTNVSRYRDGGTTYIHLVNRQDEPFMLYFPSPLKQDVGTAVFAKTQDKPIFNLVPMTDDEKEKMCWLLDIKTVKDDE